MAAFFLQKEHGQMHLLKLMKLLYLADRESFIRFDCSISGDKYFSMRHGPVLSGTKELMNGDCQSMENGWSSWIDDKADHKLALTKSKQHTTTDDLDELSIANLEVLETR